MSLLLETRHLSKSFGAFAAVSDVSVRFAPGLIHAVLGENGAGKSTFLKLLFALHSPTAGEILLDGREVQFKSATEAIAAGLGMVQQHFSLVENLSVIDNVMLGAEVCTGFGRLDREKAIARMEALLPSASLRLDWQARVEELSVGQKQKVEILKLLFRDAKILFLDEPTAVLTPQEILDFFEVLRALKAQGRTVILITHKIHEVLQLCDTYSVLRAGRLVIHGDVRAVTSEQIVESMIGRKIAEFGLTRQKTKSEFLLEVKSLESIGLKEKRGQMKDISLSLSAGEILGVAGVEGSGQSQLVEALLATRKVSGDIRLFGESIRFGQTRRVRELGVALVPEDRHRQALWLEESCHINMAIGLESMFVRSGIFSRARLKQVTAKWAQSFDVRAPSFDVPASSLSGGNQQKLVFAREVIGRKPRLLICHQPTRGVDLGAIDLIHRQLLQLRDQGLGILLISSELDELLKLSDRIQVFYEGRNVAEFFPEPDYDRMAIGAAMTGSDHAV